MSKRRSLPFSMNSCMWEWHDGHQATTRAARSFSLPTVRVAMPAAAVWFASLAVPQQ
jgi:hypothetical protein